MDGVPDGFGNLANIIGSAAADSGSNERLKAWWIYRILFSPHPLEERLTLMWHNHFATSNLKVNDLNWHEFGLLKSICWLKMESQNSNPCPVLPAS